MEPAAPVDQNWDRTVPLGIWPVKDLCLTDVAKLAPTESFVVKDCSMWPLSLAPGPQVVLK
jgi:hypothetical protein